MSFFAELKRRNVFKVAAAYLIISWLIMQAGDTLAPALHLPEWVNSLLAFFLILGFPLALFFSWAFEMTPEGIKKEKDVDRSKSMTSVTGQKLNNAIIGVLVLALAYFAIDKFVLAPGRDLPGSDPFSQQTADQATNVGEKSALTPTEANKETIQSIAVLPFVDMSANNDNEYFSDGLTEELLNILANIKELRVAGRTSSFAFKGKDEDLRSIGEKLNVVSILEGSVRKDDKRNRVRITAQLVNVADGYHLWSESYDRDLDDIFAIQDEIAHEVARALRITLLGEDDALLEQVKSTEINAYDFYLKGLQGINESGFVSLDNAVTQFQQALSLDPAYTPAKVGLVKAWTSMANTGAMSQQQALSRGLPLLEQVLAEQPNNSAARVQMANLRVYEGDIEAAEKEYIAALDDNPRNTIGLKQYGRFLFNNGQVEKGMTLIQAALEIDPYSTQVLWEQCQTNAYLQRVEIALAACERFKEIEPESPQGWYGRGVAYNFSGDIARGAKAFSEAIEKDPGDFEMLAGMAQFWLTMGDAEQAGLWLKRAEAIGAGQPVPIISRLMLLMYREQHELARDLAKKTLALNADDRFGSQYTLRQLWAFELASAGDYQSALTPFRQSLPWAFETELVLPQNVEGQLGDIIQIAALLKLADATSQRPAQLLEVVEELNGKQHPGWGIWASDLTSAYIATIRGESETALQSLNNAWDKQWRLGWRRILLQDAVITQLRNEPGYQELIARFEADMERQRLLAYELLEIKK